MKNNNFRLLRWGVQSVLAGVDNVKIGLKNRSLKSLISFFGGIEKIEQEIKEEKLKKGYNENDLQQMRKVFPVFQMTSI